MSILIEALNLLLEIEILKARVIDASSYEPNNLVVNGTATFSDESTFNDLARFNGGARFELQALIGDGVTETSLLINTASTMTALVDTIIDFSASEVALPNVTPTVISPGKIYLDTATNELKFIGNGGITQTITSV